MPSENNEIALQNVLMPEEIDPRLAGFEFASPDDKPFITLDINRRFYFNAALRKMFRIHAYDNVALAYRHDTREIAVFTGRGLVVPDNHQFTLDKRHYASARKFVKEQRIDLDAGPIHYVYSRGLSKHGVYVFKQIGAPKRKDVTPVTPVEPVEHTFFTPAIASVTLNADNRLQFEGLTSTSVYVAHNTKTRNIEVSYDEIPNSKRVNVDADGLTAELRLFSGMYADKRPLRYAYIGVSAQGALEFRK